MVDKNNLSKGEKNYMKTWKEFKDKPQEKSENVFIGKLKQPQEIMR